MMTIKSLLKHRWLFPLLIMALFWGVAGEATVTQGPATLTDRNALIYVNKASNNAIYGYRNHENMETPATFPQIVYVNQAYGQAIYSYPRQGPDATLAFNVEYISPAYGQAIYSYPHNRGPQGWLKLFPAVSWFYNSAN